MPPAKAPRHNHRRRATSSPWLVLPLILLIAAAVCAIGFAGYVFWPRWPSATVAQDAPSLPVTVGGVGFNIPPAAIRQSVQRNPGNHARMDLTFMWPSLAPPDAAAQTSISSETPLEEIRAPDRVFMTIAAVAGTLSPQERRRTIYPRYVAAERSAGPGGLILIPFRDDTPYRGEDYIIEADRPDAFAVRCTRPAAGGVPGTCLHEQRIGESDITIRFPRDWLDDWQETAATIEKLVQSIRAHPH